MTAKGGNMTTLFSLLGILLLLGMFTRKNRKPTEHSEMAGKQEETKETHVTQPRSAQQDL